MPLMIEVGKLRVEDGRAVGMRTYSAEMLAKVSARMDEMHEGVAARAVLCWLDATVKPHGRAALDQAAITVAARMAQCLAQGNDKDAAYCDVAAWCIEAVAQRGGGTR